LLPEKYTKDIKNLCRANPTRGGEAVDLPPCHVAESFSATPSIFTAGRTIILPSERPELRSDRSGASAWLVSSFLAASKIATAPFVGIWCFRYLREFGADLVDGGKDTGHRLFFRFSSSTLEFIRCSLHHSFRSHVAADHVSLVFRREWCTFQ